MRVAIYARVSSAGQRDKHTIQSQLTTLRKWIKDSGHKPAGEFVDDGFSAGAGKLAARKGFAALSKAAMAGDFDQVAVVDIDRLTRTTDMEERGHILGVFQRSAVSIYELGTGAVHDLASGMGGMLATMRAVIAAEEREKIRERTRRGKERAIKDGRKPYGKTPYGLSWSAEKGWTLHPTESPIVREIYERVAAGESCKAIGRDLAARKVKPPRQGQWTYSIWRLVAKTTYRGRWLVHRATQRTVQVPPIVDEALWYAAQEAVSRSSMRGLRRTKHTYLCEGLMTCGLCGSDVWVQQSTTLNRDGTRWRKTYYQCKGRRHFEADGSRCLLRMWSQEEVDRRVWTAISAALSRPGWVEKALGLKRAGDAEAETWRADLDEWKARLSRLEQAESAVLDRFTRGLISEGAMDTNVRKIAAERAMLQKQINTAAEASKRAKKVTRKADEILALLGNLRPILATATPEQRREIARAVMPYAVTLTQDTIECRLIFARVTEASTPPCERASNTGSYAARSQGRKVPEIRLVA